MPSQQLRLAAAAVALLAASSMVSAASAHGGCDGSRPEFDYLDFVQQWPATEGSSKSISFFTIHGLWPTNNDGSYPCDCPGSFNTSAISDLMSEMDRYWPAFRGSSSDFWEHEYEKHGTCSVSVRELATEYGFFSSTLKLNSKFDIASALADSSINPGQSYSVSDIHNALSQSFGADGVLSCTDGKLDSVSLCLDKNLSVQACPSATSHDEDCSGNIEFPSP